MTTQQLLSRCELLGLVHYPEPPTRRAHLHKGIGICDCGREAHTKIGAEYQCDKCAKLQEIYSRSFHVRNPIYVGEEQEEAYRERRRESQKMCRWRRKNANS